MSTEEADLERFDSKAEAIKHLIDNVRSDSILFPRYAREVAAPWGHEIVNRVDEIEYKFKDIGAIPPAGKTRDDTGVGAYRLVKLLVKVEGREPIDVNAVGNGFYARANFKSNIPLLLDEIDGASPRDYDGRWRPRLRKNDRDIDVEGLYDEVETADS